jgi:hypothetical protein
MTDRTMYALARRQAARMPPDETATALFFRCAPSTAYHEAGHAVMHWRHGWRFRYLTTRPRNWQQFAALVRGYERKLEDPGKMAIHMKIRAAGQIAQDCCLPFGEPEPDEKLLDQFARAHAHPDVPWVGLRSPPVRVHRCQAGRRASGHRPRQHHRS